MYIQRVVLLSLLLMLFGGCTPALDTLWSGPSEDTANPLRTDFANFYSSRIGSKPFEHEVAIRGLHPIRFTSSSEQLGGVVSVDEEGHIALNSPDGTKSVSLGSINRAVTFMAISANQRFLAVSHDLYLAIWDLETLTELIEFSDLKTRVSAITFDPASNALLVAGLDGRIYRWKWLELLQGSIKERSLAYERYLGHSSVVSAIAYHPQGRVFFSGDWYGNLSAWRAYDGDLFAGQYASNIFGGIFYTDSSVRRNVTRVDKNRIESLVVSPKGTFMALGTNQDQVELWGLRGFTLLKSTAAHQGLVRLLAFSSDEKYLASYGRDKVLRVWAIESSFVPLLDETQYELVLHGQKELPDVRALKFINSSRIMLGLGSGEVIALDPQSILVDLE